MQSKVVSPKQNSDLFAKKQFADSYLGEEALSLGEEPLNKPSDKVLVDQLSSQLLGSYEKLEQRVHDLTSELASVSEQRLDELTEKECLANRLEALIQSLPGGVIVIDSSGLIVESNPAAEALLEPQLQFKYWRDVISRCFMPRQDDGHEVSNKRGQRISIVTRSLENDGQIILLTDQSETRRLQSELSRNERLSALGRVVSTLAHQIRTPLSSAMLYANHLCESSLNDQQREQFTGKLKKRLEYMERQVSDMLLFVKGDVPLNDRLNLLQLKESLLEHIEPQMSLYQANYELYMSKGDCVIQCNHDALIGAVLNLVTNSLQVVQQPRLRLSLIIEGHELVITITDNGTGASPDILNQAKDLFFTTKEQGTGIGLSVVNHVVDAHGGCFILENSQESGPFSGLCAEIRLPVISS